MATKQTKTGRPGGGYDMTAARKDYLHAIATDAEMLASHISCLGSLMRSRMSSESDIEVDELVPAWVSYADWLMRDAEEIQDRLYALSHGLSVAEWKALGERRMAEAAARIAAAAVGRGGAS